MKKLHDPTRPDMIDGMDQDAAWDEIEREVLAEMKAKKPKQPRPKLKKPKHTGNAQ